jgi:periplasmic divalent cation tolerance protein
MSDIVVLLSTVPREQSEKIARDLVERHLAACVNMCQVTSCFRWEGAICREDEELLIIKTTENAVAAAIKRIKEIHPYDLPEIIVLPVVAGHEPYVQWIRSETGS